MINNFTVSFWFGSIYGGLCMVAYDINPLLLIPIMFIAATFLILIDKIVELEEDDVHKIKIANEKRITTKTDHITLEEKGYIVTGKQIGRAHV